TGADPQFAHGLCFRTPPERDEDFKPTRTPANRRDIAVMLEDLERVEPFRRHAAWFPTDVVEAEAAKRPRKHIPGTEPPSETTTDENAAVPTVRVPAPAPPPSP